MKKNLITLSALLLTSISFAETIQCKVVSVHDGDTITCITDGKEQIKVRLWGIDAPESGQDFGQKSKQALSDMVFGKEVLVETHGNDKYKRILGTIIYRDFQALQACEDHMSQHARKQQERMTWECNLPMNDINLAMVKQGMAWWYKDYAKKNLELLQAEQEARDAKRGLWSQPNPTPPWKWREQKGMK